jgi:hypothetical protein
MTEETSAQPQSKASTSGKKILVAHLGAHKTATSLIQNYFKDKKKYYLGQGVYPLARDEVSPFVTWGERVIKEAGKFNAFLRGHMEKTTANYLLFSNENILGRPFKDHPGLYPEHSRIIDALPKVFEGMSPRVVYSIRPQWELLESYYLQKIHQGDFMTFNQFVDGIDLTKLSWVPVIEKLRDTVGVDNVKVLDFGLIRQGQEKFISEFVSHCLSPSITPDLDYDTVHNPSISDRGLHIALRINPLLRQGETGIVRKFLQTHFSNLTEPRPLLMNETMRSELKQRYADEYAHLVGRS